MLAVRAPSLFNGAAAFATISSLVAVAVAFKLPAQHGTVGPYNYHRAVKVGRRFPWRRLPRAL
ncbi:hypothetical protein K431DRAFT_283321 [Polychaeton citri CBS 116435]|uniref:Uncharacterized protein n=1 Tax=Polychaeton citri CBS 116435 TaxID=1314669 RepID=A0A9P4QED8_9PEZI|nr:hypothetical protein K431DRAFT_283321 [Polychaeton citri CBS 116435]